MNVKVHVPSPTQIFGKKLLRIHPIYAGNFLVKNFSVYSLHTQTLYKLNTLCHTHSMPTIARRQRTQINDIVEHHDTLSTALSDPNSFLDRNHPENDDYMKAIEHVQRQIMHASGVLRTKQVQILKSVFAGENFTTAGQNNGSHHTTVSKLVKSPNGQRLLNLLHYHMKLLEGPNEALRRNMLWRIAVREEEQDPKTSIKALEAINKMHFQKHQLENPASESAVRAQVTININQNVLPKGKLDE